MGAALGNGNWPLAVGRYWAGGCLMNDMMFTRVTLALLLVTATALVLVMFVCPLIIVCIESLRQYVPGSIGANADAPFTFENYGPLLHNAYFRYFADTIVISLLSTLVTIFLSYPTAHILARTANRALRTCGLSVLLAILFTSALVKVYSIALVMGPVGFGGVLSSLFGTYPTSRLMSEISVSIGLISFLYPISTLTLMNAIQNVNPNYVTAAVSLGSSWTKAYIYIELPQCRSAIMSTCALCFTLGVSAFVIPLILGRGQVSFVTNLIYTRFSEIANYPSGASLATLLLLGVALIFALLRLANAVLDVGKKNGRIVHESLAR